jgi:hypothetical protein
MRQIQIKCRLAACLAALAYGGCSILVAGVEKAGRALDGSAFAEREIAAYRGPVTGTSAVVTISEMRSKAGEKTTLIRLDRFPMMRLRGSMPDAGGELYLTALEYLSGNTAGWNEFTLGLSGAGRLLLGETEAVLSVSAPEAVEITKGKIHRYDTRITGDEALINLRNRRERILALTEWMRGRETAPHGTGRDGFESFWKPLLFPETVPEERRPARWRQEGDAFVRAEDIRWNTGYTGRIFPGELRPVRDSGTLLRDWEEALNWVYFEYEWDGIMNLLAKELTAPRKKQGI